MAYVAWVDRCIFNAASAGLGDFVVSSAVTGYLTPAQANASDQYRYRYSAQTVDGSGNITDWEVGTGVYTVSTTTLARTTIEFSSNSNNKVNFATAPQVMVTALTGDFSSQLDGDTNFYVATTGSDTTGNGTIGLPWKTLQKAFDTIIHFDLNGHSANIQIANGTYASVTMQLGNGSGTINFIGATAAGVIVNPTAVLTGVAFQVGATNFTNLSIGIQDLTCSGTGIETGIVATGAGSVVSLYGDVFFTNLAKHIHAAQDSSIYALGSSITLTGNATTAILVEDGSSFVNFCPSIVCVGTPAWSNAFADCNDGSLFETENVAITFTGAATGKRFIVENGSVINTGTNNLSYFPGDVVGDILTGGQYDSYGVREVLVADRNYYVATTGNNANNGSSGSPWLTIQHAMDHISQALDIAGFNITVNIGAGTFAGIGTKTTVGSGLVLFKGAGSTATFITSGPNDGVYNFAECWSAFFHGSSTIAFDAVAFTTTTSGYAQISLNAPGSTFVIGNPLTGTADLEFDVAFTSNGCFSLSFTEEIRFMNGNFKIVPVTAPSFGFMYVSAGASVQLSGTWTITGTPAFGVPLVSDPFFIMQFGIIDGSGLNIAAPTFVTAATGDTVVARYESSIVLASGLPTTSVGSIESGSVYNGNVGIAGNAADAFLSFRDTNATTQAYWNFVAVNSVFSGVDDQSFNMNYNLSPSNTRVDTSQPAFSWEWEPYFNSGPGLTEHNWSYTSRDGLTFYRPFAFNITHDTNDAHWDFTGADVSFRNRANGISTTTDALRIATNSTAGGTTSINGTLNVTCNAAVGGAALNVGGAQNVSLLSVSPTTAFDLQALIATNIPTATI